MGITLWMPAMQVSNLFIDFVILVVYREFV
jgi:hypothetical protein